MYINMYFTRHSINTIAIFLYLTNSLYVWPLFRPIPLQRCYLWRTNGSVLTEADKTRNWHHTFPWQTSIATKDSLSAATTAWACLLYVFPTHLLLLLKQVHGEHQATFWMISSLSETDSDGTSLEWLIQQTHSFSFYQFWCFDYRLQSQDFALQVLDQFDLVILRVRSFIRLPQRRVASLSRHWYLCPPTSLTVGLFMMLLALLAYLRVLEVSP